MTRARIMPTVRTTRPSRHFWAAETCSTRERTRARATLPRTRCAGIGFAAGLFALELRPQPTALEECQIGGRAVGGVGPHLARGVVPIKHGAELTAVASCRVGDAVAAQKAEGAINADVVLVAERRHGDLDLPFVTLTGGGFALSTALDGPAPVTVDLRAPRRFPLGRHPAALDRVLPCLGQPRPARLDHRRVDNLSAHASQPLARSSASNRANNGSAAPARANCSRNSQIVLASGTGLVQGQPDKPHE